MARLEPHLYTEAQYRQATDVVERMTRDGITIFPWEPSLRHPVIALGARGLGIW